MLTSKQLQIHVYTEAIVELAKYVVAHCRDDEIRAILHDELCIKFGKKLCRNISVNIKKLTER